MQKPRKPKLTKVIGLSLLIALLSPVVVSANERAASPQNVAEIKIPLSDGRNIGPNSVRFAAGQFSKDAPTIVLLGMTPERWPFVRKAIKQAVYDGYGVAGIHIGPTNVPASLEIYAKGQHVTRPINPNTVSAGVLTQLIRDVVIGFY